jgi:hypothetical protein
MEVIRKLENMVAGWFEKMPHISTKSREWLVQNVWWLVLVWTILGALGIFWVFLGVTLLGAVFAGVGGAVGAAVGGFVVLVTTIAMLTSIIAVVLSAMAVSPLKMRQKKGWSLIFIVILLGVLSDVLMFLFDMNFFSLIWSLLFTAMVTYFLFEIRGYFNAARDRKKVPAKQEKAK